MLSNLLIFSFDLSIQQSCFHPWKSADSTNPPVTSFSDRPQKQPTSMQLKEVISLGVQVAMLTFSQLLTGNQWILRKQSCKSLCVYHMNFIFMGKKRQ